MTRNTASGQGVNKMALQSVQHKQSQNQANPSWWPFVRFSKQDGKFTYYDDPDIDLGEFEGSFEPKLDEHHRRRGAPGLTVDGIVSSTSDDASDEVGNRRTLARCCTTLARLTR